MRFILREPLLVTNKPRFRWLFSIFMSSLAHTSLDLKWRRRGENSIRPPAFFQSNGSEASLASCLLQGQSEMERKMLTFQNVWPDIGWAVESLRKQWPCLQFSAWPSFDLQLDENSVLQLTLWVGLAALAAASGVAHIRSWCIGARCKWTRSLAFCHWCRNTRHPACWPIRPRPTAADTLPFYTWSQPHSHVCTGKTTWRMKYLHVVNVSSRGNCEMKYCLPLSLSLSKSVFQLRWVS